MIRAQLPDGRVLEFPDGTADDVIDGTVKKELGVVAPTPTPAPAPVTPTPAPTPSPAEFPPQTQKSIPEGPSPEALESVPQVGGGIVGGIAAGAAGASLAPIIGAVALGAGAGEAFRQLGQYLSGSLDAPKTSMEAAKRIGLAGIEEGTWEAVGGLAMKGVGKILSPYKKKLVEGAGDVIDFFRDKIKPVVLIPSEATESRALDLLGNVAESSIIGGSTISKFKTQRTKFFDDFADSLIDQFGKRTDPSDLGNLFVGIIENKKKAHAGISRVLYNNVSKAIDKTKITERAVNDSQVGDILNKMLHRRVDEATEDLLDLGFSDESVQTILRRYKEAKITKAGKLNRNSINSLKELINRESPIISREVMIPTDSLKSFSKHPRKISEEIGEIEAKNAGDDLLAAVMDLPDSISFDAAKDLRSRLISRVDEFSIINKKAPAIGKAKKMIQLVDESIESSLSKSAPEALEAWRIANRFYREGQEKFNNVMIRRLMKLADDTGTGAEMIAPSIFKPGQVSRVRKVRSALGGKEWSKLQGFFVQHLLSKSTDVNGQIMGKRILNNISGKPNSFGLPMLHEVLSPAQVRELQTFGKAVELSQARQSEGAGRVLIQLTQAGAIGAILTGNMELPAATIVFGPAILSKMLLNPRICHILTKGVNLPVHSPEAGGLMARLVAASHRIEGENND